MYTLQLDTAQMIFTRGALLEQMELYGKSWREAFIKYGKGIGDVYLPAIRSARETVRQIEEMMPDISK